MPNQQAVLIEGNGQIVLSSDQLTPTADGKFLVSAAVLATEAMKVAQEAKVAVSAAMEAADKSMVAATEAGRQAGIALAAATVKATAVRGGK